MLIQRPRWVFPLLINILTCIGNTIGREAASVDDDFSISMPRNWSRFIPHKREDASPPPPVWPWVRSSLIKMGLLSIVMLSVDDDTISTHLTLTVGLGVLGRRATSVALYPCLFWFVLTECL